MKSTVAALLCIVGLIACGQTPHNPAHHRAADSLQVKSFDAKSLFYQNTAPDSAIYYAGMGLKVATRVHYKAGEGMMLNRFARINEQYGNFKLAAKYQKEALAAFQKVADPMREADAAEHLGILEGKLGNVAKGVQLIESSLRQFEKSNDTAAMISAYTSLGAIYEFNKHSDKALEYYSHAEQLNKEMPLTDEYFDLISSMGNIHAQQGNHREAINYYEKGINQSKSEKHAKAHIALLNHAARSWDSLKNKSKAYAYHLAGLEYSKTFGLSEEAARSLIGMANSLRNEDDDQSILHLKNALTIANSIGQKQLSAEIYSSLSDIYRQHARYQDALGALEAHHHLLDSVMLANKVHKISVLQKSYDLSESKLHIETLELANQVKTNQRNAGIMAAIALLLIASVLTVYFYRTNRLNKRLKESNLVKDKLFSIIGHDLRNPIGGITQLLAMMEKTELPAEKRQEMISAMRKQGDATLEILNALLQWGQVQLKGIQVQPAGFNAKNIIVQNIEALHQQAAGKSVVVTDHTPGNLNLFGDVQHFDFIIRNLLSNAIKFSHPSGTIELAIEKHASEEIVFSVTDHGKGISKQQQDLFSRSNLEISYGTKGEKGTGIGLMLSKEFIRANNGRLWLQSEEGKGTTFYFSFSAQEAA